jgi:hypothetical protein
LKEPRSINITFSRSLFPSCQQHDRQMGDSLGEGACDNGVRWEKRENPRCLLLWVLLELSIYWLTDIWFTFDELHVRNGKNNDGIMYF